MLQWNKIHPAFWDSPQSSNETNIILFNENWVPWINDDATVGDRMSDEDRPTLAGTGAVWRSTARSVFLRAWYMGRSDRPRRAPTRTKTNLTLWTASVSHACDDFYFRDDRTRMRWHRIIKTMRSEADKPAAPSDLARTYLHMNTTAARAALTCARLRRRRTDAATIHET